MAPIRDPVLTVWQALKLLNKVHVQCDFPEVSVLHVEAERALFSLVLGLARWEKTRLISSEDRVITHWSSSGSNIVVLIRKPDPGTWM